MTFQISNTRIPTLKFDDRSVKNKS